MRQPFINKMALGGVALLFVGFVWFRFGAGHAGATAPAASQAQRSSLAGTVWHDRIRDGWYNEAIESAAPGIDVELVRAGQVVARAATSADGTYVFGDLDAGTYNVRFVVSAASSFTAGKLAALRLGERSRVDGAGLSAPIELMSGDRVQGVSAGIVPWTGRISVRLWDDTTPNGDFDSDEAGVPGHMVQLIADDGAVLATATTDDAGRAHLIASLGTYRVRVVYGQFNQGGDNDVSEEGFSESIVISRDSPAAEVNAAGAEPGEVALAINGQIRIDENRDGVIEDDTNVPRTEVALYREGDDTPLATTTTGDAGQYRFEGLDPAWGYAYRIGFIAPVGYRLQPDNWSDRFDERFLNRSITARVQTILVVGESGYGAIGNRIWSDNGDGVQTPACPGWEHEPGLAGIEVRLYSAVEGEELELMTTTTSNRQGRYMFFGYFTLDPYLVEVVAPPGAVFAAQHVVDDDEADSDVDANGRSARFTLEELWEISDLDAGIVFPDEAVLGERAIGDMVWLDTDGDGIQGRGEPGVEGVRVELYAVGDETGREIVDATTSSSDGTYELRVPLDLRTFPFNQRYVVQVVAPPGFQFTTTVRSVESLPAGAGPIDPETVLDDPDAVLDESTVASFNSDVDGLGLSEPFTIGCVPSMSDLDVGLVRSGN